MIVKLDGTSIRLVDVLPPRPLRPVLTRTLSERKRLERLRSLGEARSWGIAAAREEEDRYSPEMLSAMFEVLAEEVPDEDERTTLAVAVCRQAMREPSLQDLATLLGVSRERARQVEAAALGKYRAALDGRPKPTALECYAGKVKRRIRGQVVLVPASGRVYPTGQRKPRVPRAEIDAAVLRALTECAPEGRYVTAADVQRAAGFSSSSTATSLQRLRNGGQVEQETNRFGRCGWRVRHGD